MGYPTAAEEISIIRARKTDNPLAGVRSVLSAAALRDIRDMMADVRIDDALYTYIVTLVTATRRHPSLALGASPAHRWRWCICRRHMPSCTVGIM